jgi:hypothetical protein
LKNKLLASALILCIASLALIGSVKAQTITAGVGPGMVFDYHIKSYWTTSDSYSSIPDYLVEANKTSHVEVRISTVNETNVDMAVPYYFNNDTAVMSRSNVNFLTGEGYGFQGVIAGNLNAGATLHPSGTDGLKVMETVTRSYESGSREVNHVQIIDNNETAGYVATRNLYFDKATGILVEQVDETTTNSPSSTSRITWTLDSTTNVEGWVVPEFPVTLIIPVFLIAAALAAIAYKKKFTGLSSPL